MNAAIKKAPMMVQEKWGEIQKLKGKRGFEEEAMARKITVDGDLLKLIEEMKKKGKTVAICVRAVKKAHALPTLGDAESPEERKGSQNTQEICEHSIHRGSLWR